MTLGQCRCGPEHLGAINQAIPGPTQLGSGCAFSCVDPAPAIKIDTGDVVSTVGYSTKRQVDAAVAAAKQAQIAWARTTVAERAGVLTAAVDAIAERSEEISRWITTEMGKTIAESREEVIDVTLTIARASIEDARRFGGTNRPAWNESHKNRRTHTIYQPIGVAGFISPWNFPVEMVANCVGALMMGNACVSKPSEWAPFGPQLLVEAFTSAGLPQGLINLIYGGPETGELLVTHPDVGFLAVIGSTAVGEQIASAAGVKRLLLELGGNGPLIVLDDADVDAAVDAAVVSCFYMAGQVCTSAERILVHSAVHDEFVQKLTARAAALTVGDPLDESTELGPVSEKRILPRSWRTSTTPETRAPRSLPAAVRPGSSTKRRCSPVSPATCGSTRKRPLVPSRRSSRSTAQPRR